MLPWALFSLYHFWAIEIYHGDHFGTSNVLHLIPTCVCNDAGSPLPCARPEFAGGADLCCSSLCPCIISFWGTPTLLLFPVVQGGLTTLPQVQGSLAHDPGLAGEPTRHSGYSDMGS